MKAIETYSDYSNLTEGIKLITEDRKTSIDMTIGTTLVGSDAVKAITFTLTNDEGDVDNEVSTTMTLEVEDIEDVVNAINKLVGLMKETE